MARTLRSLRTLRSRYPESNLDLAGMLRNPYTQFGRWMAEAMAAMPEPHAVNLATATRKGRPSARVVLLKGVSTKGFEFYTNYRSRKGREIAENPYGALTCYWYALGRQVRAEGRLKKVPAAASDRYFASRPRESQLGAWASEQSTVIAGRQALLDRYAVCEQRYRGGSVPRPAWWGGYLLVATRIEFWQSREGRLHDRIVYDKTRSGWRRQRLSP